MPSPTTPLQMIRDGLALTNAIGTDQTLTTDEAALGLRVYNDILENWSTQNLFVWGTANQTFNTVAGQAVYTIGTGGNWNTDRPVNINDYAYATINGVTFPFTSIDQQQYNRIAFKAQAQEFPYYFLYVNDFPLGLVTLWPVPNAVTPLTFSIDRLLTAVASVGTTVSYPPGYAKAFKYALAVELAPYFGKSIAQYPDVMKTALDSFSDIKRANQTLASMPISRNFSDAGLYGGYNWRAWP